MLWFIWIRHIVSISIIIWIVVSIVIAFSLAYIIYLITILIVTIGIIILSKVFSSLFSISLIIIWNTILTPIPISVARSIPWPLRRIIIYWLLRITIVMSPSSDFNLSTIQRKLMSNTIKSLQRELISLAHFYGILIDLFKSGSYWLETSSDVYWYEFSFLCNYLLTIYDFSKLFAPKISSIIYLN